MAYDKMHAVGTPLIATMDTCGDVGSSTQFNFTLNVVWQCVVMKTHPRKYALRKPNQKCCLSIVKCIFKNGDKDKFYVTEQFLSISRPNILKIEAYMPVQGNCNQVSYKFK